MAFLSPIGGAATQFFDNNGDPLSGGKIYTYLAGTTTPTPTYTSISGTTPHPNPIILDAAGRVPGNEIWLNGTTIYKFVVKTSTNVLLSTSDNIIALPSSLYTPPYANAVQTTLEGKLATLPSVTDFGAVGDGVTDDTVALQTAFNSGLPSISIPQGKTCLFSSSVTLPANFTLCGPGGLKPASTAVSVLMPNINTVVDGVSFIGAVQDTLYSVAINGLASYFNAGSLVTGGGILSSVGSIAGNALTLGFVTDSGTTTTEVFSDLIPIDATKRYVVHLLDDFVTAGYVAGKMKIRAFDSSGNPIVGNATITVDGSGYYDYILPATFSSGNYLFLDGASFIQVSLAVTRSANQKTGNTTTYDLSKFQFLELTNYLASSPKSSLDNTQVILVSGTNNTVKNCYFRNLPNLSVFGVQSTGMIVTDNVIYNCLCGIGVNTTTGSSITSNVIIADFNGYGNRAYRWKAIAGINNTDMLVSANTCRGNHWGFELIENTGLLYDGCAITHNHVDAISAAMSLAGYKKSVVSNNTCITRDLSYYLIEFPQYNLDCEISGNVLIANTEMMLSTGISGLGNRTVNSAPRVTNNRIRATVGMTCLYGSPTVADDPFNILISDNIIEYGSTAIFTNIGDLKFVNNTLTPIVIGSNQLFGVRSAAQLSGAAAAYTLFCAGNIIVSKDAYAISGVSTRNILVERNTIRHEATACEPIHYENFALAPTFATVTNNDITTNYSGLYISFVNTPFAGSSYSIYGNSGGTAKISVATLALSSSALQLGSDDLVYIGTVTPAGGTYSKTIDAVKPGAYWLSVIVHNGDFNHSQYSYQKMIRITPTINVLNALTSIQTASNGTLITALTVATATGSIVISGTNNASLNGLAIPYRVVLEPAPY